MRRRCRSAANAGLLLSNTRILGNNRSGSHTDLMNFNINLTTLPSLPATTYTRNIDDSSPGDLIFGNERCHDE